MTQISNRLQPWYRAAIALYGLCLVALVSAYFGVALMDVSYSIYVQGPPALIAGQPQAMRGLLTSAQTGQVVTRPAWLELGLLALEGGEPDEQARLSAPLLHPVRPTPGPSGLFELRYGPALPPGEYLLVARAAVRDEADRFVASQRVHLKPAPPRPALDAWPQGTSRSEVVGQPQPGLREVQGPVRLEVIPARPELVRGLPQDLFLRTVDAATGQPLACQIDLEQVKGLVERPLPPSLKTDAQGLARLRLTPILELSMTLRARCDEAATGSAPDAASDAASDTALAPPSQAKLHIETVAAQVALTLRSPLVVQGQEIEGAVVSLPSSGPLFVDAYAGGRWLESKTFGLGQGPAGLRVPALEVEPDELVRVQVSLDLYMQGRAWDERAAWVVPAGMTQEAASRQALERLAARHALAMRGQPQGLAWAWLEAHPERWAQASSAELRLALEAALRAIPPRFEPPVARLNSLSKDRERLEARKASLRQELLALIVLALGVGLTALAGVIVGGVQELRRREALVREVEQELEDSGQALAQIEASFDRSAQGDRRAMWAQGVVVVGTLIIFVALLVMLLRFL